MEDNEALILAMGVKQKYAKRRREQATFLGKKKPKSRNLRQQLAEARNLDKAVRSKTRLQLRTNCRTKKDEDNDNDNYNQYQDNKRTRVTWRALGMEPYLEHPAIQSWRADSTQVPIQSWRVQRHLI